MIKINKLGTDYLIKDKRLEITAYVSEEGITLFTKDSETDFTFICSKPEIIARLGTMIMKIGKEAMKGKL